MVLFDGIVEKPDRLIFYRTVAILPIVREIKQPVVLGVPKPRRQMRWLNGSFASEEVQLRERFDAKNRIA